MKRRNFLQTTALASVIALSKPAINLRAHNYSFPDDFELDELTIAALQEGMKSGKYTARSLARKYIDRIGDVDRSGPRINSVLEINPEAVAIAETLDRERKEGKLRGPVGSSRVDLQACKLEYSIVSPK